MRNNIIYRPASCSDVNGIHHVEKTCFLSPWSKRSITDDVCANASAMYIVAECRDQIVGFCGVHHILDEGHIVNVAVLPAYRKCGIGRTLVKTMMTQSPFYVDKFTLEVRTSNAAAIKVYSTLGFRSVGVRPRYYSDTGEDALIMWQHKQL